MTTLEIKIHSSRKKPLKVGNITFRSFFDFEIMQRDLEKCHRELNEKEEDRDYCIHNLRKKLKKHTELRYRTDDCYLLAFLRFRKFDIDKAYSTIRKGHSLRMDHPELFALPPNLEQLSNMGFAAWLPYSDEEGRIILTAQFAKWHLPEMSLQEVLQLSSALLDIACANPHIQINGTTCIWDFKGLTLNHTTCALNPSMIWNLSNFIQECYPNRIKIILFVNCNSLLHAAFKTAKFFLKKKIADRIKMIGSDVTDLHQYVNPAVLPKDLGGTLENEECSITQTIMDNLSYLKYIRSITTVVSNSSLH